MNSKTSMKIKCPKCNKDAEMPLDYSMVKCGSCDLDMSYGEYVKFIAHNQPKYSDILGDYASGGSTEGQTAGSLDEWD